MKKNLLEAFIASALVIFSVTGNTTPITSLFGTGLDLAGNPLTIGEDDPHYTVNENGSAPAQALSHPGYFPNNSNSQWIWQNVDGRPANVTRTFSTSFDLTEFDLSSVEVNGSWGTDNQGLDILINGTSTGISLLGVIASNYTSLTPFTINSGFISGINTLEFIIKDDGGIAAFRTELNGTGTISTVPVPAAVWLLGSGLIGLIGMRKKVIQTI